MQLIYMIILQRGRCAIHHAIEMGMVEPLKILLKYGARLDIANNVSIAKNLFQTYFLLLNHC